MKTLLFLICVYFAQNTGASEVNSFISTEEAPHQLTLLNHGLGSLEARLQMVERAQKSIDVEYFIYNLDKSGRIFTQALVKKAQEGVKVRILLDYFMAKSANELNPFLAHELDKFGIEVKYFNVTSSLNLFSGQHRNHRKLVLIDGKEALTGGRNLGDEYFDLREGINYLDRDILVSGAIVSHIQTTFDEYWNAKISTKVKREDPPVMNQSDNTHADEQNYERNLKEYNKKIALALDYLTVPESSEEEIRSLGKSELALAYQGLCENMSLSSNFATVEKTRLSVRVVKDNLIKRIRDAKESIVFDSTYFIADEDFKAALEDALSRNVEIKVLTNSLHSSDAIYVITAFDNSIRSWIKRGLKPYIYKADVPENYPTLNKTLATQRFSIHAKSFVFDNKDVVIGTFNFDPRSANLNNEMTVSCDNNPVLAKEVSSDIELRMKSSIFLDSSKTANDFQLFKAGFIKKLGFYIMKYPSIWFDHLL